MPTITSEERIGSLLEGKYRLDRILGEGGMGVVFAGEHTRLKRPIAVKFLHAHVATNSDARRRFLREAESAALLKHPNVVDVMDAGESPDGSAYMVLEFLKGDSLADRLDRVGRLTEAETLALMIPVLEAVGYAHAHGIVHRDLKPDNVFLSDGPNGTTIPKVLDFGIAKLLDGGGGASATQTGSIMGTPLYMSPEQAHGLKTLGPPADVWSLGVILYQCVTGRLPWDFPPEPTLPMILVTIATRPAAPIAHADPSVTPDLAAIIDRCMVPDASLRFQDAAQLAQALAALRGRVRVSHQLADSHADTAIGIQASSIPGLLGPAPSVTPATLGGSQRPSAMPTLDAPAAARASEPQAAAARPSAADAPTAAGEASKPATTTAPSIHPRAGSSVAGLPSGTVSMPIRSMTRALWAIAAVAAIALVGGAFALFTRTDSAPAAPQIVVQAPPSVAAPPPVVAAPPPAIPAAPAAVVAAPDAPPVPPRAGEAVEPRVERARPTAVAATPPERRTPPPPPVDDDPAPRMTTTSTMRRCANGVCSDLGGL